MYEEYTQDEDIYPSCMQVLRCTVYCSLCMRVRSAGTYSKHKNLCFTRCVSCSTTIHYLCDVYCTVKGAIIGCNVAVVCIIQYLCDVCCTVKGAMLPQR